MRIALPLAILAAACIASMVIYQTRPEASPRPRTTPPLLVSVVEAHVEDVEFTVRSRGRATPRTQTLLSSEVAGAILEASERFAVGELVRAGDALLQVDPRQYQTDVQQARAALARARSQLAAEQALADYAEEDYQRLEDLGANRLPASELTLRRPQLAAAIAEVRAAQASLQRAQDNLDRTSIRAPFDALIREKRVDLGQYVVPGTPLLLLQAVDRAEVRLPVTLADLEHLPVEALDRGERALVATLEADIGGRTHRWQGSIYRSEGVIDPESQVVHLIAEIEDPYNLTASADRPTLRFGTFLAAQIRGLTASGVVRLPRAALDADSRVWRIDADSRIHPVPVQVARSGEEQVYLRGNLSDGDRISITPVQNPEPGAEVRIRGGAEIGEYTPRYRRGPP